MSDISKCRGVIEMKMCPKRDECYRFAAPITYPQQSWIAPIFPCYYFTPIKRTTK